MIHLKNEALKKIISVDRIIGKIESQRKGPTVVFFGGIHGNETAGVFALKEVFSTIDPIKITGTVYGISGNINALNSNQRFINEDLNRIWLKTNLKSLKSKQKLSEEEEEQKELFVLFNNILKKGHEPFYFIDLHTTSSKTIPFITINDALINRKFSKLFPVPIVLGIEEYLNGPLLSYINELGYLSLGFESGQHYELEAINNSVSFVYLALVFSGVIKREVIEFNFHFNRLKTASKNKIDFFEIIYLHKIKENEVLKMKPGFKNFQRIKKNTVLALSDNLEIESKHNAIIFMPLYQTIGSEGFFIIKKIKPFFLKFSSFLRRIKADNLFVLFPGISWEDKEKEVLQVNLKIAKFLVKPFFHLLGYRNTQIDKTHLKLYNRERVAKTGMYKNEIWYKENKD